MKELVKQSAWFFIIFYFIAAVLLQIAFQHYPYFWDSIQLGSKHAHWYFEQNFSSFFLPEAIDSGHPPFFGMYTALAWKLFGKNLLVSHWIFFPFFLWTLYLTWKIAKICLSEPWAYFLPLFLLADPSFLSQALLMGPDLILINFFLLTLLGLLQRKAYLQIIGVIGLSLISMRGMMCAFSLFLYQCLQLRSMKWSVLFKALWVYLPGAIIALSFLFFHYQNSGWIGYHAGSPWASSFQRVGWNGLLRNIVILVWRLFDFGRVIIFVLGLILLLWFFPKSRWKKLKAPFLISVLLFVILAIPMIIYTGVNQHRYLLPLFLLLSLLFFQILEESSLANSRKIILLSIAFVFLFSGNRWIYPEQIAQGWDSTLAHRPYYELRNETIAFLDKSSIDLQLVGSSFPALGNLKYHDLTVDRPGFKARDLQKDRFIFYSNIMNDFSDEELTTLYKDWSILFQKQKAGVKVIIFEKKSF